MKVSDYIARELQSYGIQHVFGVTGSSVLHLVHSIGEYLTYIPCAHEQGAAMAADAYARIRGMGCAVGTSGPGMTNLITGIAASYVDSVPVLFLTGNVPRRWMRESGDRLRQLGGQEMDPIPMVSTITKYSTTVVYPNAIRTHLRDALYIGKEGRWGPTFLDLPDDILRSEIEGDVENDYEFPPITSSTLPQPTTNMITILKEALGSSQRPIIVPGYGMATPKGREALGGILGIPMAPTWGGKDMIMADDPRNAGTWGPYGEDRGNWAIQNCDLLIALGTRLDPRVTMGYKDFAPNAQIIVVDIDPLELGKFHGVLDVTPMCADGVAVLRELQGMWEYPEWSAQIEEWREPVLRVPYTPVDPYLFIRRLSNVLSQGDTICIDTGATLAYCMQEFQVKDGQRLLHAFNATPMGWALPASIGASLARGGVGTTICLAGDGGFHMNIQELATVVRHDIPVKIFVLNNGGYGLIKQTEDVWMDGEYIGSSVDSGLSDVSFYDIARAYNLESCRIEDNESIYRVVDRVLRSSGPVLCEVMISPDARISPKVDTGCALPGIGD